MIRLFKFQEAAIDQMVEAIDGWRAMRVKTGIVLRDGRDPIPFIGSFEAIMGSGKTPLMVGTLARLGPALVIWTSKNSSVVDQAYDNLRGTGKYAHLLPAGTTVMRGMPSRREWRQMLDATERLTIWVMTTASWNAREGDLDRLNLRRQQRDWAGEIPPWEQLRPEHHPRPLWVVYDEAHNQTDAQIDQITEIRPYGVLTGTGTTRNAPRMARFEAIVDADVDFGPIHAKAQIRINTSAVVGEGLLKSEVRIGDANGDPEAVLDAVVADFHALDALAADNARALAPRALYVVEESNTKDGSEPRPVSIWRGLVDRGISPEAIAVFTNTRGDLPNGLEKVTAIDGLRPRHRHIIFNKALAEGWDDPENYILYFDGVTKAEGRIKQVVGRVLRQPDATHFDLAALNAAYIHIACPDELFDTIVTDIADDLRGKYGADDKGKPAVQVIRTSTARMIEPTPEAAAFRLPILELVKPPFEDVFERLCDAGREAFAPEALVAEGIQTWRTIDLAALDRTIIVEEATRLERNTIVPVREHFAKRLRAHNRFAANLVPLTAGGPLSGPRWSQRACHGSEALAWADEMAQWVAEQYEARATFDQTVNAAKASWTPAPFLGSGAAESFRNAAHAGYPLGNPWLNDLERDFARALDAAGGTWARNPSFGEGGYAIPLPKRVGNSQRFFPDFVWWIDGRAWVIDTTAAFLMAAKIGGKLVAIEAPRVALVARGRLDEAWNTVGNEGWTMVAHTDRDDVRSEHFSELSRLLSGIRLIP